MAVIARERGCGRKDDGGDDGGVSVAKSLMRVPRLGKDKNQT
jgi:hypothetical protein